MSCCVRQYQGPAKEFVKFVSYCQRWKCFFSDTLFSFRRHISELMVPGFARPMQLLRSEVDRFQRLSVYDFRRTNSAFMSVNVVKS